jgi:hypothetical protein
MTTVLMFAGEFAAAYVALHCFAWAADLALRR